MMWYFLLSDAFTFAGFLIAYGALRVSMPTWPVPDFVFSTFPGGLHDMPLIFVTVMTFVLLFSSYTMVRAVQEGKARKQKRGHRLDAVDHRRRTGLLELSGMGVDQFDRRREYVGH